jgi:hypothetical protein
MKTIRCEIFIIEDMRRQDVIPAVVAEVPDGMTEVKAAHFILSKAAEALPPIPQPTTGNSESD